MEGIFVLLLIPLAVLIYVALFLLIGIVSMVVNATLYSLFPVRGSRRLGCNSDSSDGSSVSISDGDSFGGSDSGGGSDGGGE